MDEHVNQLKSATLIPRFRSIDIDGYNVTADTASVSTDWISRVGQSAKEVTRQSETRVLEFLWFQYDWLRSYDD